MKLNTSRYHYEMQKIIHIWYTCNKLRDLVRTIPGHPHIQLLHFFNVLLCMKGWVLTDISVNSLEAKHNMFQNDCFEQWCESGPAKGILYQHKENRQGWAKMFNDLKQHCVQQTFYNEVSQGGLDQNVMNDLLNNRLVQIVQLEQPLFRRFNFLINMIQDPNIANYPDVKLVLCRAIVYSNYATKFPGYRPYNVEMSNDMNLTWEIINSDTLANLEKRVLKYLSQQNN